MHSELCQLQILLDAEKLDRLTGPVGLAAPVNDYHEWLATLRRLPELRVPAVSRERRQRAFDEVRGALLERADRGPLDDGGAAIILVAALAVSNATGLPFRPEDIARFGSETDQVRALAQWLDAFYESASAAPAGPVAYLWIARAVLMHPGVLRMSPALFARYFAEVEPSTEVDVYEHPAPCRSDRVLGAAFEGDAASDGRRLVCRFPLLPPLGRLRLALGGHFRRWTWRAVVNLAALLFVMLAAVVGVVLWHAGSVELEQFDARYIKPFEKVMR